MLYSLKMKWEAANKYNLGRQILQFEQIHKLSSMSQNQVRHLIKIITNYTLKYHTYDLSQWIIFNL